MMVSVCQIVFGVILKTVRRWLPRLTAGQAISRLAGHSTTVNRFFSKLKRKKRNAMGNDLQNETKKPARKILEAR
jgi:predicted butyrate kinase (DUF1464 family)